MLKEIISVTLILFSIIDVLGNIPIFISLKSKNIDINPLITLRPRNGIKVRVKKRV